MLNKASLLIKLTVGKNLCTVDRQEIKTGRIKYFIDVLRTRINDMFKVQLLFLVFAIPMIGLIFALAPILRAQALSGFYFASNIGIGYSENVDSISEGVVAIYAAYRIIVLYLIPAIAFMGIGAAGLFYCARGFMWGEPVIPYKAFFRGIKKLWKYYIPVFVFLGVAIGGIGLSVLYGLERIETIGADAISYLLILGPIFIGLIIIMIIIFMLPMFSCYKFKFIDYLKNSVILNLLVLPLSLIMVLASVAPIIILSMSSNIRVFLLLIILGIFFIFIAAMWTTYAQNIFDTMIQAMYETRLEAERKRTEKPKKHDKPNTFVNPKKKYKSKATENKQPVISDIE